MNKVHHSTKAANYETKHGGCSQGHNMAESKNGGLTHDLSEGDVTECSMIGLQKWPYDNTIIMMDWICMALFKTPKVPDRVPCSIHSHSGKL